MPSARNGPQIGMTRDRRDGGKGVHLFFRIIRHVHAVSFKSCFPLAFFSGARRSRGLENTAGGRGAGKKRLSETLGRQVGDGREIVQFMLICSWEAIKSSFFVLKLQKATKKTIKGFF